MRCWCATRTSRDEASPGASTIDQARSRHRDPDTSDEDDPKAKVVVSIGIPRPNPLAKHEGWHCPFLIDGLGESNVQLSYGTDAMQALIQALAGIRYYLKTSGRNLQWFDSLMETGFPLLVQTTFGKGFEDRVGLAVERETIHEWRNIIRIHRAKIRAHEAKLRRRRVAPQRSRAPSPKERRISTNGNPGYQS